MFFFLLLSFLISGPAMAGSGEWTDVKQVEDFSRFKMDAFPDGWEYRWTQKGEAKKTYAVKTGKESYLEATSIDSAVPIAKAFEYNLGEYPFLCWQWQVLELPKGGDERHKNTGDSAAGIYVIFPGTLRPDNIKYVWSASLPVGTVLKSPYNSKTKIVVLRNQLSPLGTWTAEKVNVYQDYKKLFGREPDPVQAIGIMSDSDNTQSRARAYYRAMRVTKN
jgi:hypothetical protein